MKKKRGIGDVFLMPVLTVTIMLSGCALYQPDMNPVPLVNTGAFSVPTGEAAPLAEQWYATFRDDALAALIGEALAGNMDVRQAIARVEQAQALERQSRAALLPSLNLEAETSKEWEDGEAQQGISQVGVPLSWEVDAFGRLRAVAASRHFSAQAAAEDVEAIRLALSAEVAEAWFGGMAQQLQLRLLHEQQKTDAEFLSLVQQRRDAGVGTSVEVLQQRGQLAESESLIPVAEAALRVFENRLDVLTGAAPDAKNRLVPRGNFAELAALPPVGVPSDLLLSRPDLRALRNRLVAADADIGVAIAARLPRITLNGSYLYSDGPVAGPVASLLAGLVMPLLDWGARRAEVERNKALYEEGLAAFTQAYLEAIEDVENALYQENRQREFIQRLETRRSILNETLQAAQAVYRQGESDYLPVLDALQDLRAVERSLIAEQLDLILFRIQLFRALGGPPGPSGAPSSSGESP
jgi:NodT family efflux transporter outer membrane factor (OMF) lipoprotein